MMLLFPMAGDGSFHHIATCILAATMVCLCWAVCVKHSSPIVDDATWAILNSATCKPLLSEMPTCLDQCYASTVPSTPFWMWNVHGLHNPEVGRRRSLPLCHLCALFWCHGKFSWMVLVCFWYVWWQNRFSLFYAKPVVLLSKVQMGVFQ